MVVEKHRSLSKGGGVAIVVKNGISFRRRHDLDVFKEKSIELVFIKILAKNGKHIIVGSMFRPPNGNCHEIIDELNEIINKIKSEKEQKEIIKGLDHNLDLLKSATHNQTQ